MLCRTLLSLNTRHYSSLPNSKHYDIVISGGGMIGSTLACALAQNPILNDLSILMIESGPEKTSVITKTSPYSNRVSSINPSSQSLFDRIGVWDHIHSTRTCTVDAMKVWGHTSDEVLEFHKSHNYQDHISHIVENNLIIDAVQDKLKQLNVDVVHNAKIAKYSLPRQSLESGSVEFASGERVDFKLLLGTDGARSQVRQAMNVKYVSWDYEARGIVATVRVSAPGPNTTAWQRFVPDGNVALLPLTEELSSLVWSTTPDKAKALVQMSPESFVHAYNEEWTRPATASEPIQAVTRLAHTTLDFFNLSTPPQPPTPPRVLSVEDKSRASFPLGFGHAVKYVAPACALLGDAAHRIHPLAGQGVNLGFGDIVTFERLAAEAVSNGYPIGHLEPLTKYESERQRENLPTMLSVDLMYKIYRSPFTPVQVLGTLGLQLVNAVRPIKRVMMGRVS